MSVTSSEINKFILLAHEVRNFFPYVFGVLRFNILFLHNIKYIVFYMIIKSP